MINYNPANFNCWNNFGSFEDLYDDEVEGGVQIVEKIPIDGSTCKKCKEYSKFSEPNQPDNSFICYVCRNRY